MEDAQGPEKGTGSSTRMSEKPQTCDYAKSLVQMIMSDYFGRGQGTRLLVLGLKSGDTEGQQAWSAGS